MSVVTSEIFSHTDERNITYSLKSYALDDKFHLYTRQSSVLGGTVSVHNELSVSEAQILKKQLEEFIALNNGGAK